MIPLARLLGALALAAASTAAAADGPALYREWCARCHGEAGDGRGLAAPALALNGQPPRDFTAGRFRYKSTPDGTAPADADLARVIREGLPGTAMPYFGDLLTPEEVDALVAEVRGFDRDPLPDGAPLDPGPASEASPGTVARGARLYGELGCPDCHGTTGEGGGARAAGLRNEDGSPAVVRDLTRPWTFRGGDEPAEIALRLATGLMGTPMPSYREAASTGDLLAVAHYVRSLARAPSLRASAVEAARRAPGEGIPLRERGEYLVKSGTCFLCHVQMRDDGSYDERSFGAGGMTVSIDTVGTVYSRNLTPDAATGLGGWSARDLGAALREGRSRDGRRLNPLDMPWTILAGLEERDVEAIHTYLRSLSPVRNLVPPPRAPGFGEGLVRKLGVLVRGEPIKAGFHPRNAGRLPPAGATPAVRNPLAPTAALLVGLVLCAAGAIAFAWRRRWISLAGGLAALALALVYSWPPLLLLPVGLVRADPGWQPLASWLNLPPLRPPPPVNIADADLRALAGRGRYVAAIGTCPLCHTAGPNVTRLYAPFPEMGGGMKVNWKVFGTTYSRNLTPDGETGLGRWSDREIRRAITSGISRDGRRMHWQAMPWDHFSNLSLEDLEALTAYLRHLAPAFSRVPAPEPPRPGDEEADTFWFGYTGEYRPEG